MIARTPPTRAALLQARRLGDRVERGAALLRRKREALVRALMPLARPAAEARRAMAETAAAAYRAELDALAAHGAGGVAATSWPARSIEVEVEVERVWGLAVPALRVATAVERDLAARGTAPGPIGPALFEATNRFEALIAQLLDGVTREARVRALGDALARTSRQLHTLEQRVVPALDAQITATRRALDERDREEQARLRHLRTQAGRTRSSHACMTPTPDVHVPAAAPGTGAHEPREDNAS